MSQYAHPTDGLGEYVSHTVRQEGDSPLARFFVDFVYEKGTASYGPTEGKLVWTVVKGGDYVHAG